MFKELPLSHPQKRIWYNEKLYPNTSMHNIGGTIIFHGEGNISLLKEAINHFIQSHEATRIRLVERDGEPFQFIQPYEIKDIDYFDFRNFFSPEQAHDNWLQIEAERPFPIYGGDLFYFATFSIRESIHGYLAKFHHLIADGWSLGIMTEQIGKVYGQLLNGVSASTYECESYFRYLQTEQKYIESARYQKDRAYWNEKLDELPDSFLSQSSKDLSGVRESFVLEENVSDQLRQFVTAHQGSLNTLFVSLLSLYMHKCMLQEEVLIGTPVLNRTGKQEKSIFGMFTSSMPFRVKMKGSESFLEWFHQINKSLKECYIHQKFPYNLLVNEIIQKQQGLDQLFQIYVNYYNTKHITNVAGMPVENKEFYCGSQLYSLQIIVKDWSDSGCLSLDFDYKLNDFSSDQIREIYRFFRQCIDQLLVDPEVSFGAVSSLSSEQFDQLVNRYNATRSEYPTKSIVRLFEDQACEMPHRIALEFDDMKITYQELNEKSNQVAHFLKRKGVGPENPVAILFSHSLEVVYAILGILKAGGVYVPIDPDYPVSRINYILRDSQSRLLLKNVLIDEDIEFAGEVEDFDRIPPDIPTLNMMCPVSLDNLAYIIYTSGSTGEPKGVMVDHRGLANYIWWAKKEYVRTIDDVFALYSSFSFDLTVTSIFTPLIGGNTIQIYRSSTEEFVLYRVFRENKVNLLKLTPSHLYLLRDEDWSNSLIHTLIVGGEDLKIELCEHIFKSSREKVSIFNEYGPTETVVGCMLYQFKESEGVGNSVPIGRPAPNTQIYVLDEQLNPMPVGCQGELYIGGVGVSRGYLNKPEQTSFRFIQNPFVPGDRMFRTGDLGKFTDNETIVYLGRKDDQVKLRGYRIELGEIESAITLHPDVSESVVSLVQGPSSGQLLCAYIVLRKAVSQTELRHFLSIHLPPYMIPSQITILERMPLTPNGKVDRKRLPTPEIVRLPSESSPPRNEKEKALIQALKEVLSLSDLGMSDHFLELGGDSIKAIQVSSKLLNRGWKVSIHDVMSHPRLSDLAAFVENSAALGRSRGQCHGEIPIVPIVSWFFERRFRYANCYTQSVLLKPQKFIEPVQLEELLGRILYSHDALRINTDIDRQVLRYNTKSASSGIPVLFFDLSALSHEEKQGALLKICEDTRASFRLEEGILFKCCLFQFTASREQRLFLVGHHLVVDAYSWRIILEDLEQGLNLEEHSRKQFWPRKTDSFKHWAEVLNVESLNWVATDYTYWAETLERAQKMKACYDFDLGEGTVGESFEVRATVQSDLTQALRSFANKAYRTETRDLLISAIALTVRNTLNTATVCFEMESHGRDVMDGMHLDVSRTVGWFTSMFPFVCTIYDENIEVVINTIKENLRKIPRKGSSYGYLKYAHKLLGSIPQLIRLNYLGDFTTTFEGTLFELAQESTGYESHRQNTMTSAMDINIWMIGDNLMYSIICNRSKFREETAARFAENIIINLQAVVDHCLQIKQPQFVPSDFDTVTLSRNELANLFE